MSSCSLLVGLVCDEAEDEDWKATFAVLLKDERDPLQVAPGTFGFWEGRVEERTRVPFVATGLDFSDMELSSGPWHLRLRDTERCSLLRDLLLCPSGHECLEEGRPVGLGQLPRLWKQLCKTPRKKQERG